MLLEDARFASSILRAEALHADFVHKKWVILF
jgi:hypothetical protein